MKTKLTWAGKPVKIENAYAHKYKCNIIDSQKVGYIDEHKDKFIPITPSWCPLKKQNVVVKLDGGN